MEEKESYSVMENEPLGDSTFIWIPFVVLLGIIALSALVYLMARTRREKHIICKHKLTRPLFDTNNDKMKLLVEKLNIRKQYGTVPLKQRTVESHVDFTL